MSKPTSLSKTSRQRIISAILQLFKQNTSPLYGVQHALSVETELLAAVSRMPAKISDITTLQTAALLHDIGFAKRDSNWSNEGIEHVSIGKKLALDILSEIKEFRGKPFKIEKIGNLIELHDSTTYRFPSPYRAGETFNYSGGPESSINAELSLLKEADALVHGNLETFNEHVKEWQKLLPLIHPRGDISTWQWMESVIGNVRLLARRVLLDVQTDGGKAMAIDMFNQLENWVSRTAFRKGIVYTPQTSLPVKIGEAFNRLIGKQFHFQLVSFRQQDALKDILRQVTLIDNTDILPYQQAKISIELIDIDSIHPMALYVLRNRLEEILELHDAMLVSLGMSLFDLPGLLDFRYNSSEVQTIAPPLVEEYFEERYSDTPSKIRGLVDGLHRVYTAKRLGMRRIRVILISEVRYPLVPVPVEWEDITIYNFPPPTELKRVFRFGKYEDFPVEQFPQIQNVDRTNFQYYFFRDLKLLGSLGKRKPNENTTRNRF